MNKIPTFLKILVLAFTCNITQTLPAWAENGQPSVTADKIPAIQHISIDAGNYFFKPELITVKVNQPVEITIAKENTWIPHNITMNEPDAGMVFNERLDTKPTIIRFTPKKTGSYPFYCDEKLLFFASHRKKGMEGIIVVTE